MATETQVITEAHQECIALANRAQERIQNLNAQVEAARGQAIQLRNQIDAQTATIAELEAKIAILTATEPRVMLMHLGKLLGFELTEKQAQDRGSLPALTRAKPR